VVVAVVVVVVVVCVCVGGGNCTLSILCYKSILYAESATYYTLPVWSVGRLGIHCMLIYLPYVFSLFLLFYYPTSCYPFILCLYHFFFIS